MNYLIINGSPHKGNTWKVVEAVKEDILIKDPSAVFNEIHLAEQKLPFCCGCSACFRLGHEKCPHSSIIIHIIDAIEHADGIVVASTTYNMRETSLLKNLFDHLCFMMHRPHFFTSKALIVTTTGGVGGKAAAKSISSFLKGIGFNRCYLFSVATSSWNDYIINEKARSKIFKISSRFSGDVLSEKLHNPSCLVLIPYNLFRGMSLAYVEGTQYETQDGVYWTDKTRKNSIYDVKIHVPFYNKPFGQLFYLIGRIVGKAKIVTYKK